MSCDPLCSDQQEAFCLCLSVIARHLADNVSVCHTCVYVYWAVYHVGGGGGGRVSRVVGNGVNVVQCILICGLWSFILPKWLSHVLQALVCSLFSPRVTTRRVWLCLVLQNTTSVPPPTCPIRYFSCHRPLPAPQYVL